MMARNPGARARLVGVGLLAATFLTGGLAGAAIKQVRGAADPQEHQGEAREERCRGRREPYAYLNLTGDQKARIDAVFERRRQQMDAFWKENGPRMEMIVDSARAEFQGVLTHEQRTEYDRRRTAERERRKQRERECDEARRDSTKEESR
ncbi:MAG: hypothetical protein ACRELX_09160 [Longimicrobiales bacterium]